MQDLSIAPDPVWQAETTSSSDSIHHVSILTRVVQRIDLVHPLKDIESVVETLDTAVYVTGEFRFARNFRAQALVECDRVYYCCEFWSRNL